MTWLDVCRSNTTATFCELPASVSEESCDGCYVVEPARDGGEVVNELRGRTRNVRPSADRTRGATKHLFRNLKWR